MCGIAFTLEVVDSAHNSSHTDARWQSYTDAVRSRGPDASDSFSCRLGNSHGSQLDLRFHGSVLHMRGDQVTPQPLVAENGDVLLWNGEVFDGLEVGEHDNDGRKLLERIERLGPDRFLEAIGPVEGPYAFVYLAASTRTLYYGRDPLGRRSLLRRIDDGAFVFALISNAPSGTVEPEEWAEVDCAAIHSLRLEDWPERPEPIAFARKHPSLAAADDRLLYPFDRLNPAMPQLGDAVPMTRMFPPGPVIGPKLMDVVHTFLAELKRAVRARVATVPHVPPSPGARIAVLFSGGIDCTVVAAVLDRVLPPSEAIDLINVAFENPRSLNARDFTQQHPPKPSRRGIRGPRRRTGDGDGHMPTASTDEERPSAQLGPYDVPDRLTARDAWQELRTLRPERRWNLVEVDVPYQEMLQHRQRVIDLMKPQNTVMDLSISLAFYFAARGRGHLATAGSDEHEAVKYTSQARVLLSGLGADELLGGYARHRRAFHQSVAQADDGGIDEQPVPGPPVHQNWRALLAELQLDLDRLPTRNLGRDDRIISTHGKEARYPFLAGHVVDFLARQPVWFKADMRFEEGVGDKMLLRILARELGLREAGRRKKRAIHFGARTAKMDLGDGKAKGTDLL